MGITKVDKFEAVINRRAELAKAFAHPARVAILDFLSGKQSCVCGDIVDELPLSQSTVSQHLKELKRIGIIKGEIDGPRVCYCIDGNVWKEAQQHFMETFDKFVETNACC
ncbi:ArsR/SmtB family transcription factor [Xanthovirga aplysinae]|uniref:ArsR/SmtB family transcription factor n=1 Tax=Xanthovirga aplysinae TaxID=2529853 RepID=UPI0012BC51DF|nr:metalloregulator ArsR/SmtB family transcription factor [Xanthovirga aplysinae]MTI30086.1 ArsR family transcriptional regulator [Xanthovirga aplysinae]